MVIMAMGDGDAIDALLTDKGFDLFEGVSAGYSLIRELLLS